MNIGSSIIGARNKALLGVGTGSAVTIVTGVAGKAIRVLGYVITTQSAAAIITFTDSTPTTFGDVLTLAPLIVPIADCGWFETAAGADLKLTVTNTVAFGGHVLYQLVNA